MTPESYDNFIFYFLLILSIEFFIIVLLVGFTIISAAQSSLNPSPEVIYYFQNCNNLTIFPDGCQVLS